MWALLLLLSLVAGEKVDGPVIGIDLGTTFSCVGVYKNGVVEIVPNEQGQRLLPSYVAYRDEETLVGEAAKSVEGQVLYDVKRLMGRSFAEVQREVKSLPYKVVSDAEGNAALSVVVKGKDQVLKPEDVSALILSKLKDQATAYLGEDVQHAVVSVPAFFNDAMRLAVQRAGAQAGLQVLRLIHEPTAAAVAYGFDSRASENLLVYDLGGGTCDVSVLRVEEDGTLRVLATSGDPRLGGESFDEKLVQHLLQVFKKKTGAEPEPQGLRRLRLEAEKAKRRLSTVPQVTVQVPGLAKGHDLSESLSRGVFEKLNDELFTRSLVPVRQALKDAQLEVSEINQVILAGGSARIPKVQQMLSKFFGKELTRSINPDEVVAHGAAIQAAALSTQAAAKELSLIDVTPLSLGIRTAGGFMSTVLPRNSPLPAENMMTFSTHKDNQASATVKIYQGERSMVKNNHLLGSFQIKGIPPAPRGVPQIQVLFKVDLNGLLSVEATDTGSGESHSLTLERPSPAVIEATLSEGEELEKEDQRDFARAEAKMALHQLIRTLQHAADMALEDESTSFLAAAKEAQDWLQANPEAEAEEIHEKREELEGNLPEMPSKPSPSGELDMEGHDEL